MVNLDKCYNVAQQSSTKGVTAIEIAKKLGVHRATAHGYLNSLELMGKVYSKHGLWFAEDPSAKLKIGISNYLMERFWREEEEIEKEVVNGELFRAYRKAELLRLKLPSPYKQELSEYFKTADASLQNIKKRDPYFKGVQQLNLLRTAMPFIIERLASILHEMEGKEDV